MPKYIITYDLNKEGDGYNKAKLQVEESIRILGYCVGGGGARFRQPSPRLTTVWIGETSMSLQQVYDHVREAMDKDDDLFVGELDEYLVDKGKSAQHRPKNPLKEGEGVGTPSKR